jgi:hypothetical protein
MIPESVKTYTFTLKVNSAAFPALVSQKNYSFSVAVACTVS